MENDRPRPPFGFLGLLVVGGGIGFTLYMGSRPGTISGFLAAVRADLYLVVTTLLVIFVGVATVLYFEVG